MSLLIDPEERELRELRKAASWGGKKVLEIGCGEGRLARRLSGLGACITALDTDFQLVKTAPAQSPPTSGQGIGFALGDGRRLPLPDGAFDIVVFGWSL
jgi:ubiquinone/menaquinone biosynthesis C-methylase UbiE